MSDTLDVLWYLPVTHLAALLCTISTCWTSLWFDFLPFWDFYAFRVPYSIAVLKFGADNRFVGVFFP